MAEKENEELRKEESNQTEKKQQENSAEKKENLSEKDLLKQKQEELDDITDRYKNISRI